MTKREQVIKIEMALPGAIMPFRPIRKGITIIIRKCENVQHMHGTVKHTLYLTHWRGSEYRSYRE